MPGIQRRSSTFLFLTENNSCGYQHMLAASPTIKVIYWLAIYTVFTKLLYMHTVHLKSQRDLYIPPHTAWKIWGEKSFSKLAIYKDLTNTHWSVEFKMHFETCVCSSLQKNWFYIYLPTSWSKGLNINAPADKLIPFQQLNFTTGLTQLLKPGGKGPAWEVSVGSLTSSGHWSMVRLAQPNHHQRCGKPMQQSM